MEMGHFAGLHFVMVGELRNGGAGTRLKTFEAREAVDC